MAEKKNGQIVAPFDYEFIKTIASVAKELTSHGVQIGIVCGGGNIIRGAKSKEYSRARADDMGMLSTMMNSLVVEDVFNSVGVKSKALSAVEMNKVADLFTKRAAIEYLQSGYTVIIGGGTGNPYFSTDTATILRACEIEADIALFAKNVDGIYNADPRLVADAKKYEYLTCDEIISKQLAAIDLPAVFLAKENKMPFTVFGLKDPENIIKVAQGANPGTTVIS